MFIFATEKTYKCPYSRYRKLYCLKRGKMKHINKRLLKSKASQESIGMSFNMIFSIILIIFFFVAAFVAIKYFLDLQKEMQFRTYFESFQGKVTEFYSSGGSVGNVYIFQKNAPSGTEALCYLNFAGTYSGRDAEKCTAIKKQFGTKTANFAFYSSKYDKITKKAGYKMIDHISTASLPPNADDPSCYCIPVLQNKKINITISTSPENPIVQIK